MCYYLRLIGMNSMPFFWKEEGNFPGRASWPTGFYGPSTPLTYAFMKSVRLSYDFLNI